MSQKISYVELDIERRWTEGITTIYRTECCFWLLTAISPAFSPQVSPLASPHPSLALARQNEKVWTHPLVKMLG